MAEIKISSDCLSASQLRMMLEKELIVGGKTEIKLRVKETPANTLAIDPTVLIAVIALSQATLTTLLSGIFKLLSERQQKKSTTQISYIEIKIGEKKIVVPVGTPEDEINKIINLIQQRVDDGEQLKSIVMAEDN